MLTGGAEPPVHDFGLIDDKAVIFRRLQAWSMAHRTVDIDGGVASAANEVMVVISYPRFVEGRTTGGLYSTDDAGGDERVEIVIDGLPRELEAPSGGRCDELGIPMLAFVVQHVQNGKPRRGKAHLRLAEQFFDLRMHIAIIA